MALINEVYEYIENKYKPNEPIFLAELDIPDMKPVSVRQQMKKLTEEGRLKRFDAGIYYIPKKSMFRSGSTLSIDEVIRKKYLQDGVNRCGYVGGILFANQLGLTTQVPALYEVYTNKATTEYRETKLANLRVILRKPYCEIDTVTSQAISQEDFSRLLSEKYNITFKVSRGRYSYLHPNRSKYITGRSLGTLYEEKHLLQIFQENSTSQITENPVPDISQVVNSSTPTVSAYTATTTEAPHTFLFIKSDLRLVTDLQHCIKAQQSQAYAQKVKLSNLKMMAQTVAYVQEHGFQSKADLDAALSDASAQSTDARNTLKSTENTLKNVNEQIHYTGQYLANKSIYSDYRKSRNKEKFYDDHRAELTLYESALRILKEKSQGNKLPTLKMLREEKNRLTELQTMQREDFNARREHERELRTVCSNVDIILGTSQAQNRQREHTQEKS